MRKTTNINLSLYDQSDTFNITGNQNSLNSNFEIIDEEINALNNTNSIDEVKNEVASLKEDLTSKVDKTALVKTDRKLDALWKLNQGISYEFQTDDTEAYQKAVPSGVKMVSIKSIGGKTIVWNQLNLNNKNSVTKNGISFINNKDGSWTITGTCSTSNGGSADVLIYKFADKFVSGHKYLVKADKYFGENYGFAINGSSGPVKKAVIINYAFNPIIFVKDKVTVDNVTMRMNIFDLTQMFGTGNEPSTPEEFEAMFPAEYYPYNEGELMSASVNEVIYSDTKTQETSYPIPQAILNLPGYGWSAGDVRNEVNWENKKYHKRVGKVDLGTLEYRYDPNTIRFIANLADVSIKDKNDKFNCISTFYTATSGDIFDDSNETDLIIRVDENVNQIYIRNLSYADATTFKNAMSGVILYYELAEEQITDISNLIGDTLQEPIEVEAGGSLTFRNTHGANYRVPVPNTVEYTVKLSEVAK